jgi:Flp pilus assembly protein TadG
MAVPLLLAITLGLVWLLTLATAQVRMVDATREVARALARGDDETVALDQGRQIAPPGVAMSLATRGGHVVVEGTVAVDGVGGLLDALPSVVLTAEATAAREEPPP